MSQSEQHLFYDFNFKSTKAADFIHQHQPIAPKDVLGLIVVEQDGTYPVVPSVIVVEFAVHILWTLTEETDLILKITETQTAPWYAKTEALNCLSLTQKDISWPKIIPIIENQNNENEMRQAALNLIVAHDRREFLPQLKALVTDEGYFGDNMLRNILFTRASLGDTDVILPVLEYRNDPWTSTNRPADAAWIKFADILGGEQRIAESLVEQSNLPPFENTESVWTHLQEHSNHAVVKWAISQAPSSTAQIQKCLELLSHPVWIIRKAAADWLIKNNVDPIHLSNILSDTSQARISQSWAAFVLLETRGNPSVTLAPYLESQDVFKTPWTFKSPKGVREAIINHYVPNRQTGTDIRYVLEKALSASKPYLSAKADRDELMSALQKQGLSIESCKSIGDAHQQGGGTYWLIQIGGGNTRVRLDVCELGKFVSCVHQSEDYAFIDASPESHLKILACKTAAEKLGFVWIESEHLEPVVPGLNVYFFGAREPLPIRDLLFYWQD